MRRSEIIARDVVTVGNALRSESRRGVYEVLVEEDAHSDVLAVCVRADSESEADRKAVAWVAEMVRKGMRVRR
jgi:hypothetical protein